MGGMYSPPSPPAPPPSPAARRAPDGPAPGQASAFLNQSETLAWTAPRFLSGSADPLSATPEMPGSRPTPEGAGHGFGGGSGPTSRQGLRGNRKKLRRIAQPEFGISPAPQSAPDPHKPPTRPSGGLGAPGPGGLARIEDGDDAIARQIKAIRQRRKAEEASPGAQPWPKTLADALQRFRDAYAKTAGQQAAQQTPQPRQAGLAQAGLAQGETRDGPAETGKAGFVEHVPERKPSYPPGAMILVPDSDAPGILGPFAQRPDLAPGIVLAQAAPLEDARVGSGGADARAPGRAAGGEIELRRPAPWRPEPPTASDWLAAEASPKLLDDRYQDLREEFDRTGGIGMEPGTTIAENSFIYDLQDHALQTREGAIRSKWWGVAGDVTGLLGVGAADPNVPAAFKEPTKAFLQTTSHSLASMNFENFERLAQGQEVPDLEGLRGKKLDYALVEMEQKAVTSIMEQYFKNVPPEDRVEIIAEVSERTNMAAKFWGGVSDITRGVYEGERTARVVRELFPNGDYDFANQDHRIAVGRALVDLKYADNESK